MSQAPTPYTRQNNFVTDAANPSYSMGDAAPDIDAEYEAIRTSVNQTISRLNEIQRDDGLLRSSVLDPAEYAAINEAIAGAVTASNAAVAAAASQASAATSAATATTKSTEAVSAASDALGYKNLAEAASASAFSSKADAASSEATAVAEAANAASSATDAAASAASAASNAVTASTKATEASASASAASADAAVAATKASEASLSAANASTSESAAAVSETNAAASASAAGTSEANAADSAVSAANSAAIATTKADEANIAAADVADQIAVYAEFLDLYLGDKATDPVLDNDGDPLQVGAIYYSTTAPIGMKVWDGAAWDYASGPKGDPGADGADGANGADGADGISAYDVAVANGFVGTEAEWLASLEANVTNANVIAAIGYTPASDSHTHVIADVTDLQAGLDGKAPLVHTHIATDISDFVLEAAAAAPVQSVSGMTGAVTLTSADVGLGNVDNTSDLDKPVSTATQAAIDAIAVTGATGGGSDAIFWENDQVVTTDYTVTTNKNAMTAGPISVDAGVSVTVPAGSVWTVV